MDAEQKLMGLRQGHCRSWLDPRYASAAGAKLAERLQDRLKTEKGGLFLTLTYDRAPWPDARELYRKASEERHVRRFLADLGSYLRTNFSGRWICKMEFQQGGFVHWHIILLGVKRIPHEVLTEFWGRGHVWVEMLKKKKHSRYLAKYIAKDGGYPLWLLGERRGGVHVVRASPGFWPPKKKRPWSEPRPRMPFYISVGQSIDHVDDTTILKDGKYYKKINLCLAICIHLVGQMGGKLLQGEEKSWLGVSGIDRDEFLVCAGVLTGGDGSPAKRGASPLHLIRLQDPPNPRCPRWLDWVLTEEFR